MKKTMICIFAHPDDEAFGPSGTIATYTKTHDVYIVCTTRGNMLDKFQVTKVDKLEEEREQELKESARILGVKHVYFLNNNDGSLCNNVYHDVAEEVQKILDEHKPDTILTFEPRGISGHMDHVFCSMISNYLFEKLDYVKTLLMHCISVERRAKIEPYFIYFPSGYKKDEIQRIVDVSDVWDLKLKAINVHQSQKHDIKRILEQLNGLPKEEYFLVREK